MRYALTVAILVILVLAVQAKQEDNCEKIDSLAETIMTSRQSGVPMVEMMKLLNKHLDTGILNKYITAMVKDAYKQPRFSTESYKQKEILDFRNKWYLSCLEIIERTKK